MRDVALLHPGSPLQGRAPTYRVQVCRLLERVLEGLPAMWQPTPEMLLKQVTKGRAPRSGS